MKKLISISIILIFSMLLVTGCSKKSDVSAEVSAKEVASEETAPEETVSEETDTNTEEKPEVDVSKLKSNPYTELFKSGKYLLKFEGVVDFDPDDIRSDVTIANDGERSLIIIEAEGSKSHILTIGDTSNMIDDASKSYMVGTISNKESSFINAESLEYVKSGEETIDGIEMTYEEYKYDIGSLKYYFNKKELYSIVNTNPMESVNMKIIEFSANVTEDMFTIPAGYKEV